MAGYDITVVGGGCVGLSIAYHLAKQSSLDICIIEKEHHLAQHQSGRNSGVLHPGFNYPPGSLKARFSTEGTQRMKDYCSDNDIPLDEYGVLVVATNESEENRLTEIQQNASENGVETIFLEGENAIQEYEPEASGQAGLYCPEAASVDSQQYVYSLARNASKGGVDLFTGSEVNKIRRKSDCLEVETSTGSISSSYLVNAAGLYSDTIAHQLDVGHQYRIVPFRGEYYELVPEKRGVVRSMIYPTPDPELPFLGVHFTRRTDDKVIVGPNAVLAFGREAYGPTQIDIQEFLSTIGYIGFVKLFASKKMLRVALSELDKSYRKSSFVQSARKLVPSLKSEDFQKSYAGNRAQVVRADGTLVGEPLFEHGPRSTHILNAVSPGLTSSLPFGDYISETILDRI